MRLNHIVLSCSASESSLLWSLTKAEENKMYINNFWHLSHDTHNTNIFYNSFRYFLDHLHIKDKFLFLFMALDREISNITWFFFKCSCLLSLWSFCCVWIMHLLESNKDFFSFSGNNLWDSIMWVLKKKI